MKILIVEDDFVSRLLLQRLLTPYGEVHIASNGKEAIEAYRLAMKDGYRYDLLCLDIMMPDMDGHTVLKQIRGMEDKKFRSKIIMTTALADRDNVMKAIQENCDDYIVKPITKETLINRLHSLELLP